MNEPYSYLSGEYRNKMVLNIFTDSFSEEYSGKIAYYATFEI